MERQNQKNMIGKNKSDKNRTLISGPCFSGKTIHIIEKTKLVLTRDVFLNLNFLQNLKLSLILKKRIGN